MELSVEFRPQSVEFAYRRRRSPGHGGSRRDEAVLSPVPRGERRVDVRPSSRALSVFFNGEVVARTRRALFLFETGLPPRYYVPPSDVRMEFLIPSPTTSICPYKGSASYWSLRVGDRAAEDAVWAYTEPLSECPRVKGHFSFYPEKVDRLDVEGNAISGHHAQ